MPSSFAISQACCPPAPPKLANLFRRESQLCWPLLSASHATYTCFPVACPLASVRARMGLHMVSFATLMNLPTRLVGRNNRFIGGALTRMLLRPT